MEWWQTLLIGVAGGSVPIMLGAALSRRGANKKLEIDEGHLSIAQFEVASKAYQDLLDRAAKTIEDLEKYKDEREELLSTVKDQGLKIEHLEAADREKTKELEITNDKLDTVRQLFERYLARSGVPLTEDEREIFEQTMPVTRKHRPRNPSY